MMKLFFQKNFAKASVFFSGLGVIMSFSLLGQAESIFSPTALRQASVQSVPDEHPLQKDIAVDEIEEEITPEAHDSFFKQTGNASWYGSAFHGRKTASGERYDMHDFTAAHRTLPFGTIVKVTNPENGKTALVRITDRGPFHGNRIIDLSYAAAKYLNVTVSKVELEAFKAVPQGGEYQTVAFTPQKDAVLVPLSEFSPVDSVLDFTDALEKQESLELKHEEKEFFMAVQPVVLTKGKKSIKHKFYVGVLKSSTAKAAVTPLTIPVKTF